MTIYGPKDEWPRHGDDAWNDLLDLARAKGWTLETFTAHRFGQIKCPGDACAFPKIDNSARGTTSFAKRKKRIVERCRHGEVDQAATVVLVKQHLDVAERLALAAARLVERDAALNEIEEIFDKADESVRSAGSILNDAFVAEWRASDQAAQARAALAGTPLEGATSAGPVLVASTSEAAIAEERLRDVPPQNPERPPLRQRLDTLSARIEEIRLQVGSGLADG